MKFGDYIKLNEGQSVFEVLIAIAIATLIVGSSVTAIMVSMRSGTITVASQKAYGIANGDLNNVRSFSESNWAGLYTPLGTQNKGSAYPYYLAVTASSSTSTILGLTNGTTTVSFTSTSTGENIDYTSWFTIDNVSRTSSNWIGSGTGDPTTQKITAHVSWVMSGETKQIDLVTYISKIRTSSITYTKWDGFSGVTTPVTKSTNDYYGITGNATITANGTITY